MNKWERLNDRLDRFVDKLDQKGAGWILATFVFVLMSIFSLAMFFGFKILYAVVGPTGIVVVLGLLGSIPFCLMARYLYKVWKSTDDDYYA